MEIKALTLEEIENIAQKAADAAVEKWRLRELMPKSEIMRIKGWKDNRTWNKKVIDYDAKPAGKIGKEPAYYLSSFQKAS